MRTIRRAGAIAATGLLLSGFVGGAASADTKETYLGGAKGLALGLKIGTTDIGSFGMTDSSLTSDLKASAKAAGALSPLAKVEAVTGVTGNDTEDKKSATGRTVAVQNLVGLTIGHADAMSAVKNGVPTAVSTAGITKLTVDIQNAAPVSSTIGTVQNTLKPVLDVLGGLDNITKVTGVELNADSTVDQLLTALKSTRTLDVSIGDSTSSVVVEGTKVTSKAVAQAGRIDILPLGALSPVTGETVPVASIIIGSASATAVYDRATGTSTPSFDPAIVTIRVNTPTTDAVGGVTKVVGIDPREIKITPGTVVERLPQVGVAGPCSDHKQAVCILQGTPFETRLIFAGGRTVTNPDGSVGAEADAVRIQALRNIGTLAAPLAGGIDLQLAHAEAGIAGAPATISPQPTPVKELPRTGGFPMLPLAGGTVLGLAVIGRRLLARSAA